MSIRINSRIIKALNLTTKENPLMNDFLKEILYEEIEHPYQWQYKSTYNRLIHKYTQVLENDE